MAQFMKVADLGALPAGQAMTVQAGGQAIALYNVDGTVHATSNTCPHRGGPLGDGTLEGGVITCPWHAFQFDVTTGACRTNPALGVPCLKVRLDGQAILVEV
jgi:nitrite reductase/ring-hydroxylating ferredoxin subunit